MVVVPPPPLLPCEADETIPTDDDDDDSTGMAAILFNGMGSKSCPCCDCCRCIFGGWETAAKPCSSRLLLLSLVSVCFLLRADGFLSSPSSSSGNEERFLASLLCIVDLREEGVVAALADVLPVFAYDGAGSWCGNE